MSSLSPIELVENGTGLTRFKGQARGGGGSSLPVGGTFGQPLVKQSSTDGDATWDARGVSFLSVAISSAELLALGATPKVLLPAPGGRLYHVVHNVVLHYRFGTTPYSGDFFPNLGFGETNADIYPISQGSPGATPGEGFQLVVYGPDAVGTTGLTLLAQTEDAYAYCWPGAASQIRNGWNAWLASHIENKAFSISNAPAFAGLTGAWDSGTTYEPGDIVLDGGLFYTALNENTNDEPPSANWEATDPPEVTDGDGTMSVRLWYSTIDGAH